MRANHNHHINEGLLWQVFQLNTEINKKACILHTFPIRSNCFCYSDVFLSFPRVTLVTGLMSLYYFKFISESD